MPTVTSNFNDDLPTKSSLLARIKKTDDHASWNEFFDTYKPSIAGLAMKGGLSAAEADEVVQETMLAVSQRIGEFDYDRKQGTFKGWLFTITRRAMSRRFRCRTSTGERPSINAPTPAGAAADSQVEPSAATDDDLMQLPDTAASLEEHFEKEWQHTIVTMALQRIRQKVKPKQFQMYDLYVIQRLPMSRVTRMLNVNAAQVYMAKIRVGPLLRQIVATLERELI